MDFKEQTRVRKKARKDDVPLEKESSEGQTTKQVWAKILDDTECQSTSKRQRINNVYESHKEGKKEEKGKTSCQTHPSQQRLKAKVKTKNRLEECSRLSNQ